jgi:hypothetical protein
MAKESRHHHHIPQCYLRGFTASGKLTVADLGASKFFETNPRNVAGERDFNRIEIEGEKPDALESKLSGFEAQVAESIRRVAESGKFEGDDRRNILNLIALLAVRSPQMREHIRKTSEDTMKKMLALSLASKERWERQQAAMKTAGKGPPPGEPPVTYEEIKAWFEKDEYDISLNREYHIGLELKMHDPVLHALADRKWTLYTSDDAAGCFVTTDRPVMLTYIKPREVPPLYRNSPGFGMPETEVMFPLTQHTTLVGTFEGNNAVVKANMAIVAHANTKMIHGSYGQVYAPKRSVPHLGLDLKPYYDEKFMERYEPLRKKKDAGKAN